MAEATEGGLQSAGDDRGEAPGHAWMARRIAVAYLVIAALWIVGSGALVFQVSVHTPLSLALLETVKGLVFVGVTGAGLWLVLARWERRMAAAMRVERAAADELRRIEQMRAGLLNGVSHELRTPLTALVGYAETITHRGGRLAAADLDEIARRMTANAERLRRLVFDMMDVGRGLQGLEHLTTEPVDLRVLVDAVVAGVDDPRCRVEQGRGSMVADVDRRRVERIVEHLVDNALRHAVGATRIVVSVWGDDTTVHLGVEDDGPGLPAHLVEQAFAPFVQGEQAVLASSPGVGLGLSLVREFALLHGGEVACVNGPRGGVSFNVALPRTPADARRRWSAA